MYWGWKSPGDDDPAVKKIVEIARLTKIIRGKAPGNKEDPIKRLKELRGVQQ